MQNILRYDPSTHKTKHYISTDKKIKSLYVYSLRTQELKSVAPGNWTTMWVELKSEFCSHSESSPEQKTRLLLDFCSQFESNSKWKKVVGNWL